MTTTATTPATIDAALAELGVTDADLNPQQREELDTNGFVVLPDVIDADWLAELRERTSYLQEKEGAAAGSELGPMPGASLIADLLNKGEVFERMLRERTVLAAAAHVLGDFRVNSLNFRAALPGQGHQQLHSDTWTAGGLAPYRLCNSIWLLDDFTDTNGATRVVAGSHRSTQLPADVMDDPTEPHPDERLMTGPAGSVVIFNAHLWHGGTRNTTEALRRGMTLSFCRVGEKQQTNQAEYIRKAVYDRLSPAERFLMDV